MLETMKPKESKAAEDESTLGSFGEIWRDIINLRRHFNIKDCLAGLVIGLGNTWLPCHGNECNVIFCNQDPLLGTS